MRRRSSPISWARSLGALWRRPGLAGAAVASGLVVGLVAAAPVLFVSSVGAGAVQVQDHAVCPAATGPTIKLGRGPGPAIADPLAAITAAAPLDAYLDPPEQFLALSNPIPVTADDREGHIGFLVAPRAREHLDLITREVPGDVLIPDTLAAELTVEPGATLTLEGGQSLVVAGVFRDLASRPLDDYWCAARDAIVPVTLYGENYPPPMAVMSMETFVGQGFGGRPFTRYVAPFAQRPRTVADATALTASTTRFTAAITAAIPGATVTAGISRLEQRARLVRDAVGETIAPVALLGLLCTLALAAVLGGLWVRNRRSTCIALLTIGVGPAAIGRRAMAELAGALVIGATLGGLVARASMAAWAPTTAVEPGTFPRALAGAALAGLVATVPAAITAGWTSRRVLTVAAPARRGWLAFVPVELGLAAAAWAAWAGLDRQDALPIEGRRVVDTGSSALLFPLAALALAAVVSARLWWLLTRRRSRSAPLPTQLPRRLAFRRLQHGSKIGAALLAAGTLALGVSVYGAAMTSSLSRTAEAKAGVFIGSDISFLIAGRLPDGTPGATEVWNRDNMEYAGLPVDVLGVDPDSFADAAFWDAAFADASLDRLVELLAAPVTAGAPIPALLIGAAPADGTLTNPGKPGTAAAISVVATARTFPGAGSRRPTLVLSRAGAEASGIAYQRYVWAHGALNDWRATLSALGSLPVYGSTRDDVGDASALQFASWSFDFVGALGVFVGVLVVSALLLYLVTRQRQQALAFAFLRRMGLPARRHWRALALEVGAIAAAIAVIGSLVGVACARVVSGNIDPLPSLPPATLSVVPWLALVAVVVVAVIVAVAGSGTAQALGARADVSEMLRDGQ